MVLDAKVMEWATQQGLDTAALKKAKIPIFGKWYFPDLPANTPLVNMRTGQVETFPPGYRAGAILYVKEEDLKRAGLGPYKVVAPPPPPPAEPAPVVSVAPAAAVAPATPTPAPRPAPPRPATAPSSSGTHGPTSEAPVAHGLTRDVSHGAIGEAADTGRGPQFGAHPVEHAHPSPAKYVQIAIVLAIITAVEVALYYIPGLSSTLLFWTLIVLSVGKFFMVAAYFMHLKFDHTSFTAYFAGGLALAIATFLGMLVLSYATLGAPSGF